MSAGHWLRPTVALTNPLLAYAYTRPTVALCCIGFPRRRTAHGCPVSHWDVLSLYGLRSQSWYFWQAVCFTPSIVSFEHNCIWARKWFVLISLYHAPHPSLHGRQGKRLTSDVFYCPFGLHFIHSVRQVTHSLHSTLQILHFILIALLPYCKGFPIALNMQYGP